LFASRNIQLPENINSRVNYNMKTPQDIIIEQLESEIQSLKLEKISGNNECMEMVRKLTDEIRELKKNLSVVESILRSSLPIVDADNYVD
tara:strand:- start:147 stop:416 length:270 start_codon:yes stop_codon:yes gene_type:complete